MFNTHVFLQQNKAIEEERKPTVSKRLEKTISEYPDISIKGRFGS